MEASFSRSGPLTGRLMVPGDKSISHRAAIVGSMASGISRIRDYAPGADCASTIRVLRGLGVRIEGEAGDLRVRGTGGAGFVSPSGPLDCGNSGTTMRLTAGAAAAFDVDVTLTGDESLTRRPMRRITRPLELMGAEITAGDEEGRPPLRVRGGRLKGIDHSPPVASAQVKSAVLLAGLGAEGRTSVSEISSTRDHTERMLRRAGIEVRTEGLTVSVLPGIPSALELAVPGDFSSAAFFIAAVMLRPSSRVTIESVGLNPTRTAFLEIIAGMGAAIRIEGGDDDGENEPVGDLTIEHGDLVPVELSPEQVAGAIDEVTLVALLATAAQGRTVISGAGELRHKESDRIRGTVEGLRAMGAMIEETGDGMVIEGPTALHGALLEARGDHRLAMMFAVAGLAASGTTVVEGWEWSEISYPGFAGELARLCGRSG